MKINYNSFFQNSKFTKNIIILFLIIFILFPEKSFGIPVTDLGAITQRATLAGKDVAAKAQSFGQQIKDYTKQVQSGIQIAKNTQKAFEAAKKIKLKDLAQAASGDILGELANTALNKVTEKGKGKNPLTNGQIIKHYGSFKKGLDKIATKKAGKKIQEKPSAYTQSSLKAVTISERNNWEPVQLFTLPSTAKEEICNSDKLKDVITNGSTGPTIKKLAVDFKNTGFADINELCGADIDEIKTQQVFLALAKGGYGGDETRIAMSHKNNTPSGQTDLTLQYVQKQKSEDKESLENLGKAVPSQCADKEGNPVLDFDSTKPDSICENYTTDPSRTPAGVTTDQDTGQKAILQSIADCTKSTATPPAADDDTPLLSLAGVSRNAKCISTFTAALTLMFPEGEVGALLGNISDGFNALDEQAEKYDQENKENLVKLGKGAGKAYKDMADLQQDRLDEYKNLKFDLEAIQEKLNIIYGETDALKKIGGEKSTLCPKPTTLPVDESYSCDNENKILTIIFKPSESQSMKKETDYINKKLTEITKKIPKVEKDLEKAKTAEEKFLDLEEKLKNGNNTNADTSEKDNKNYTDALEDGPNEGTVLEAKEKWEQKDVAEGQEDVDKSEQRRLTTIREKANGYLNAAAERRGAYDTLIKSKES